MSSSLDILSMLNNLEYNEETEEEQCERILHKFEQQCPKERAKRLSLEFAIEKCSSCVRDVNYLFAVNQAQKKSFTNFRKVLDQNILMQQKLVGKVKSHDWERINGLWRFKFKTMQEKKQKLVQHFQKQQHFWEEKIRSIPELNHIQKTQRIFEEKEANLLALQQEWKFQKDPLVNKHNRMNKYFQEISTALNSSKKIVTDLKQEAENLEAEVKRLNASKLEEMRLIKDLEEEIKKLANKQNKIEKKANFRSYLRTRQTSYVGVFNVPSFSGLKMQKVTTLQKCVMHESKNVKTLIEDRKRYAPMITKISTTPDSFPKKIDENAPHRENFQPEKIENIKLTPDKQIKILEHVVLKSPIPGPENILKQAELKSEGKEEIPKIVLEDLEFKRDEKNKITELEHTFVKETNSQYVPSENEEKELPRRIDYREELKVGKFETNEIRKCEPQEFIMNKTGNNVKKRKSEKSDDENQNAKNVKLKVDDYDTKSDLDLRPVKPGEITIGDLSGSENRNETFLRKAYELCEGSESTDKKPKDAEVDFNDDFESFCSQLKKDYLSSKDPEKGSDQNSENASGWAAFGNNFKFDDNNHDDKGFFM